jgi:hypothetical protein
MTIRRSDWLIVTGVGLTGASWIGFGHAPVTWIAGLATIVTAVVLAGRDLHRQAVTLVCVGVVQTIISAFGEWSEPAVLASTALSVLSVAAILYRRTPRAAIVVLLVLAVAELLLYIARFSNPVGGLLYSVVLFPFTARGAALGLELIARGRPPRRVPVPNPAPGVEWHRG